MYGHENPGDREGWDLELLIVNDQNRDKMW